MQSRTEPERGGASGADRPLAAGERRVLLLQGPPSRFFAVLREAFAAAGVPVSRLALNAADRLRAGGPAHAFRGRLDAFADHLDALMAREGTTDVIYFADRVPYHRIAAQVAERRGATPYAVENGYLRPDWITLEPGGMGAYSRFPTSRAHIEAIAEGAPAIDTVQRYSHPFATEAWYDVSHHLVRMATTPLYPHFDRDRPHSAALEYLSWVPQLLRRQVSQARGPSQVARIVRDMPPYFLLPLQLEEDYQIRHNSPYRRMRDVVEEVFTSFGAHAPPEANLIVKIHPLDNGLENWPRTLKRIKRDHGLTGRVRMLAGGPLQDLLDHAAGVVLVNSTVGLYALRTMTPTKALGCAVYDLPGLTDQQPLDAFWAAPEAPDATFMETFVRALARATQLKGSFYDPKGMATAAAEIVRRVRAGIGSSDMFVHPPPRLAQARAMGITIR